jgi:iron complex outermembrane receptor protein
MVTPSDELTINTSADFYHQGGKGVGATLLQPGTGFVDANPRIGNTSPAINAIYSSTFYFLAGNTFGPLLTKTQLISPADTNIQQSNNYWGVSTTVDWKTDAGTLTIIPAYRRSKLDFTSAAAGFLIQQQETDKQGSFEARFASNTNQPFTYLAGIYYLDERSMFLRWSTTSNTTNPIKSSIRPRRVTRRSAGSAYAITDSFRLNAGTAIHGRSQELRRSVDVRRDHLPGRIHSAPLRTAVLLWRCGSGHGALGAHR